MAVEFQIGLIEQGHTVVSWQGVRRDESLARQNAKAFEHVGGGLYIYRPIAAWTAHDVFSYCAGNRRCLREHTEQHRRLMDAGGVKRYASYADGAYTLREGSFGAQTTGAIARNVLSIPHRDPDQQAARDFAAAHGLPTHPALMPSKLAEHFVRFLSDVGDLVVDPFGGWATTGRGAEVNDRRWLVTERCREYLISAAERFRGARGFQSHMEGAL